MLKKYIYSFDAMSTPCEFTLYTESKERADTAAKAVLQETKRLEKKYNYYDESSLLSQLNARTTNLLDRETKEILQRAKQYYKTTNGVFDITVATIKELYKSELTTASLESKKETLLAYVGCEHFTLKRDKIYFDNAHTKIDLGGFVKEYAVDRAVSVLKRHKIKSALVNYGGDIYALGKKPDGGSFVIGIKDPHDPSQHKVQVLLEDQALTTSASYERHYKIEGREYSHIITKEKNALVVNSVSVISKSCVESGIYSTALMIDQTITTHNRVIIF